MDREHVRYVYIHVHTHTHIHTYIHTEMLFSLTKEENPVFCDMDDIGGHYTKFIKPDTERQLPNDLTCTWNFKKWNSKNQRAEWWLLGLKGEGNGRFSQSVQSFSFSKWFSSGDLILSWWLQIIALHYRPEMEKAIATHSSTLAWKMPWTEEPGRLQSMRSLRVRQNWATSLLLFTFMHWKGKWQPTSVFLPGESQGWGSLMGCCLWGCTESDTTEVT